MRQLKKKKKKKKTLNNLSAGCAHVQISCDYDNMDVNFVVTVRRENTCVHGLHNLIRRTAAVGIFQCCYQYHLQRAHVWTVELR